MKRVLSWLELWIGSIVFYLLIWLLWVLAFALFEAIKRYSDLLFWIFVILEFSVIIGAGIWIAFGGAHILSGWSNRISQSPKGTRYAVHGWITAVFWLLNAILHVIGFGIPTGVNIASCLTMFVFGVCMLLCGKQLKTEIPEASQKSANEPETAVQGETQHEKAPEISPEAEKARQIMRHRDPEYIDFICRNDYYFGTREDAERFYDVLTISQLYGKQAAVTAFMDLAHEMIEQGRDELQATSFLAGLLSANGVVTKDESNQINKQLMAEKADRMK